MTDPVLEWLQQYPAPPPRLDHEALFHLDQGTIHLRSNAPDLPAKAADAFYYYPLNNTTPGEGFGVDVFAVESSPKSPGIDLPGTGEREKPAYRAEASQDSSRSDLIQAITINGTPCIWRRKDYLASLSDRNLARIVATDPFYSESNPPPISRLTTKGPAIWPGNIPDLIDLIKILYIRYCNLFCIHGAAAVWRGRGLIITGPSGSGKTTTSLALIRDQFDLLSDELTLIDASPREGVHVRGMLIPPMVVGGGLKHLNNLESTLGALTAPSKGAFVLDSTQVLKSRHQAAPPRVIIHLEPLFGQSPTHDLSPLPTQEGFTRLTSQVLDLPGNDRRQSQFHALITLAESVRHYRLKASPDLGSLPGLMRKLLAEE